MFEPARYFQTLTEQIGVSLNELEIIKRIAGKDENAFRELYEGTSKKVYHYLLGMLKDPRKAEDIMVDTFTEVWKCAGKFRGDSKVSTWIIGIARHLALKEFGKKKPVTNSIENHLYSLPARNVAIDSFLRTELLRKAMEKLSFSHREILELVFFHEMSYREISDVLDIPINTVKTRVYYAKENLKQILENMGIGRDDI